jgi:hypothetical protein
VRELIGRSVNQYILDRSNLDQFNPDQAHFDQSLTDIFEAEKNLTSVKRNIKENGDFYFYFY